MATLAAHRLPAHDAAPTSLAIPPPPTTLPHATATAALPARRARFLGGQLGRAEYHSVGARRVWWRGGAYPGASPNGARAEDAGGTDRHLHKRPRRAPGRQQQF